MPFMTSKRMRLKSPVHSVVPSPHPQNQAVDTRKRPPKAFDLPLEILMEIVSYYPALPLPVSRYFCSQVLPSSTLVRSDALRSLSQVCRYWRQIFFPMLWEHVGACSIRLHIPLPIIPTSTGRCQCPSHFY